MSLLMHLMLGMSLWHEMSISRQLNSTHIHHVAGSNGVKVCLQAFGWLTRMSNHLWCLSCKQRWDMEFFGAWLACKNPQHFKSKERNNTNLLVASIGLRWGLHYENETVHDFFSWSCSLDKPDVRPLSCYGLVGW